MTGEPPSTTSMVHTSPSLQAGPVDSTVVPTIFVYLAKVCIQTRVLYYPFYLFQFHIFTALLPAVLKPSAVFQVIQLYIQRRVHNAFFCLYLDKNPRAACFPS